MERELWYDQSISKIQDNIRKGNMIIEELCQAYLDQVKEKESYHAIISLNPRLMDQAKALDLKLKEGLEVGKLFGTILLLKDNIGTKDMPVTAGAKAMEKTTCDRNAFVVDRLLAEDGLILGKANLSEWANYMSDPSSNGFSVLGGQTKNAYGDFDAGGSSSGSAVGVALNLCSGAIGSETCGSLVNPSSMNSIVTIKPTIGLVSRDLVVPITEAQDTLGPMARCVEDLWKLFEVIVGEDRNDSKHDVFKEFDSNQFLEPLNRNYIKGKRFGLVKSEGDRYKKLILELKEMNIEIVELDIDQDQVGIKMLEILDYGIVHDLKVFLNHKDIHSLYKSLDEILAFNEDKPDVNMPYGQKIFVNALNSSMSFDDYEKLRLKNMTIGRAVIDGAIKDYNLDGIISLVTDMSVIYSVAGYPAVNVPAGYDDDGCPYGITFVGSYLDDCKLLQMAYSYEQLTGHRRSV